VSRNHKENPWLFLSKSGNLPVPLYWKIPHSTDTTTQNSSNSVVCSPVMINVLSERKYQQLEVKIFCGLKSVIKFENNREYTAFFVLISPKLQGY
jgi:hypothetical protein